jgi:hypothetical protein
MPSLARPTGDRLPAYRPRSDRSPLGYHQESCNPPDLEQAKTRELQRMGDELRDVTTRSASLCRTMVRKGTQGEGSPQSMTYAKVCLRSAGGRPQAFLRGVVKCKSGHGCPDCAQQKRVEAAHQVKHVVSRWRQDGGTLGLLTLTMRHKHGDDLQFLVEVLLLAWRFLTTGSPWTRLRTRLGIQHLVRGLDVTLGAAGWHPHIHALVFARGEDPDDGAASLARARLAERWILCLRRALIEKGVASGDVRDYLPDEEHGVVLKPCARGEYIVKLGLSVHLVGHRQSSGLPRSRTPWEIAAGAARGIPRDRALWREYTHAMLGIHLLSGLDRVRRVLGSAPGRVAASQEDEVLVAAIPRPVFASIVARGGSVLLMDGAERGGLLGVAFAAARALTGEAWAYDPGDPSPTIPPAIAALVDLFDPVHLPERRGAREEEMAWW